MGVLPNLLASLSHPVVAMEAAAPANEPNTAAIPVIRAESIASLASQWQSGFSQLSTYAISICPHTTIYCSRGETLKKSAVTAS